MLTYKLGIRCPSCRALYVNGAPPVADTSGVFASATPRTLMLYAGAFRFQSDSAMTLIGGNTAARTTVETISQAIREIGGYFGKVLGIPYGEHPVFLSFRSVSRNYRLGIPNWQFVTWPTIAFAGDINFDQLVEERAGQQRLPDWMWSTLSHEMAHYYFGTLRFPAGPLFWFELESTADYLALKAVARLRGDAVLATRVLEYVGAIGTAATAFPPLSAITAQGEISELYRYRFAPLALLTLDRRVGEAKVMRMLRALLEAPPTEAADYAGLVRAAEVAGISRDDLARSTSTPLMRIEALAFARRSMTAVMASSDDALQVALAVALVNADTSVAGRLETMASLRVIARRNPTNRAALFQIGKIGALTGRELDAAQKALEAYLRSPAGPGDPSHAAAYWRLGMIAEHRGDVRRAQTMYRASLGLDPTNDVASRALSRLSAPKKTP